MTGFIRKFEKIAARYPDRIALCDAAGAITYAALWQKSAALGTHLMQNGTKAEDVIGLCFEKSADYIAALLGAWYAGAAFAPLPPSLPAARRDYIVRDAGITHFLSANDLASMTDRPLLPPAPFNPAALAYVMHTSGSTGTPKGVAVEHKGILNVLEQQIAAFGLSAQSRSLFYLSISFDAALSDIGTALLSGAALFIPDEATIKNGAKLVQYLHDHHITHADLPPSLLRAFAPEDLPDSLATVIIGGEACPPETVRRWARTHTVINVYGPTEATICTSLCRCDAETWEKPLLGDAFNGVVYKIIDEELLIGGIQLARGYLNLPDLTAQKFITLDGQEFYRSGDRVRRLADGSIAFLGRIDRQFKLRGQLIEPDEIEACLHRHAAVKHAAVLKTPCQTLAAYIVPHGAAAESDLQNHVAATLPAWMIPARIMTVPQFPKTATGKTDYAALAALPLPALLLPAQTPHIAPATAAEEKLFRICADILGHDHFSMADSFYGAGGDSLGVIRLLLEADREGLHLPPADIAAGKSLRELAAANGTAAMAAEDIKKDVVFSAEMQDMIAAARGLPLAKNKNILLTGATGFLGSRLLAQLIATTDAVMYCPVRAPNDLVAYKRIQDTFACYGMEMPPHGNRIRAFAAEITEPKFGLAETAYQTLAATIGAVHHCAAVVNMVAGYDSLRTANVTATENVLRFALTTTRKALHCASTLSVFVGSDRNTGRLTEDDRLAQIKTLYGGYAQTKFAAEWMLLQMPADVLPVSHYRFGLLTGDTQKGIGACRDFLALFAKGIAQIGYTPAEYQDSLRIDITPVDYAAAAMAHLARHAPADLYHIANRDSLSLGRFTAALNRSGASIKPLPVARFLGLVQNRPLDTAETAAGLSLCRILPPAEYTQKRTMDLFQATDVIFDDRRAAAYLAPAGIACPPATDDLIDLYIRRFMPQTAKPLHVCFFGPESTGKSTLSKKIADHFGAAHVPEFAKEVIEQKNGDIGLADMDVIAKGHFRATQKALAQGADAVVTDTDALTTSIWSRRLYQSCPAWIDDLAAGEKPDMTFLMDIDTPWVDDIHRYLPHDRENFLQACKEALTAQGRDYILLSGTWDEKFETARRVLAQKRQETGKTGT